MKITKLHSSLKATSSVYQFNFIFKKDMQWPLHSYFKVNTWYFLSESKRQRKENLSCFAVDFRMWIQIYCILWTKLETSNYFIEGFFLKRFLKTTVRLCIYICYWFVFKSTWVKQHFISLQIKTPSKWMANMLQQEEMEFISSHSSLAQWIR